MESTSEKHSLKVPLADAASGGGLVYSRWSARVRPADLAESEQAATSASPADSASQEIVLAGITVSDDHDIAVDVALENAPAGVVVTGSIQAHWQGPCARCSTPVQGRTDINVREVFAKSPVEGEHYRLDPQHVDLAPMVREAILLDLPIHAVPCPNPEPCPNLPAELVRDSDSGDPGDPGAAGSADPATDPEPDEPPRDPRWAALDVLRTDQPPDSDS